MVDVLANEALISLSRGVHVIEDTFVLVRGALLDDDALSMT